MKRIDGYKIVYIEWLDACASAGWNSIADIKSAGLAKMKSIGFLVYRDSDLVVVSSSKGIADKFGDALTIPRSNVTKLKFL